MRPLHQVCKTILFLGAMAISSAHAAVLTYDDVPGGSIQNHVLDVGTYKGFFHSDNLDWIDVVGVGTPWPYGAHGGDFAVLNNNHGVGIITASDSSDFTFDGLWAKVWATAPESDGPTSLTGFLMGLNDGVPLFFVPTALNGSYQFFGPQSAPIDELRLGFGDHFLADDLTLNAGIAAAVPEPSTYALMLAGLGFVGFVAKRRRKAQAAA